MKKIDISYASKSEHNLAQRLIIKAIEKFTGKKKLENIYNEYSKGNKDPAFFWTGILQSMNIKVIDKSLDGIQIPANGSVLMIANHPFGIIDGIIMCSLASEVRSDYKIITHETLRFAPELDRFILPIDFNEKSKNTIKNNIQTTKKAKKHLLDGGLLIIFPSGSVSIAKTMKSSAKDDQWKTFIAKLIKQTKTDILPVYFDGKNGFLFHIFASKLRNQTLKYSTYIHETKKMIGKEIKIYPGKLIKFTDIDKIKGRAELTNYLKHITYNLSKISNE